RRIDKHADTAVHSFQDTVRTPSHNNAVLPCCQFLDNLFFRIEQHVVHWIKTESIFHLHFLIHRIPPGISSLFIHLQQFLIGNITAFRRQPDQFLIIKMDSHAFRKSSGDPPAIASVLPSNCNYSHSRFPFLFFEKRKTARRQSSFFAL